MPRKRPTAVQVCKLLSKLLHAQKHGGPGCGGVGSGKAIGVRRGGAGTGRVGKKKTSSRRRHARSYETKRQQDRSAKIDQLQNNTSWADFLRLLHCKNNKDEIHNFFNNNNNNNNNNQTAKNNSKNNNKGQQQQKSFSYQDTAAVLRPALPLRRSSSVDRIQFRFEDLDFDFQEQQERPRQEETDVKATRDQGVNETTMANEVENDEVETTGEEEEEEEEKEEEEEEEHMEEEDGESDRRKRSTRRRRKRRSKLENFFGEVLHGPLQRRELLW